MNRPSVYLFVLSVVSIVCCTVLSATGSVPDELWTLTTVIIGGTVGVASPTRKD